MVIYMDMQEKMIKEIQDFRESGLYSVASLDMFNILDNLDISDKLYSHIGYMNGLLVEYLDEVMELDNVKPGLSEFLRALRVGDVVDNQKLDEQNSFLIGLYMQLSRETAMGKLIKYANNGKKITGMDMFNLNSTLLYGTSSEDDGAVRTENNKFVGKFVNGERIIDYFPIDCVYVKEAADRIALLYNDRLTGSEYDNVFIQPFLIHGLLGGLQIFNDGNTRMGRVMQHALMWQLINEKTKFNFDMPPVYATRSYYPLRYKYRDDITKLVTDGDNYAWNNWFDFNLDIVEDSIYAGRENVKTLKRKLNYY